MLNKKKLKRKEALNLYNALRLIKNAEVDKRSSDGQSVVEVVALPPKTSYALSRQTKALTDFAESYGPEIEKLIKQANDKAKEIKESKDVEERSAQDIFNESLKAFEEEEELFDVLEKPLKFSSDQSKSDFGKVQLKSSVLDLLPEWFFDWVE